MNSKICSISDMIEEFLRKYQIVESKKRSLIHLKQLTITEIKTIYALGNDNAMTMKEIAKNLDVSLSTPTQTIDHLIDKSLVKRFTGKEDRRQVLVQLTEEGKKILNEIKDLKAQTTEYFLKTLNEKEIDFLEKILGKLNDGLQV